MHSRRDDSFHNITTLYQTIGLHDTITIKPGVRKTVFKTNAKLKWNQKNLLYKTVEELEKATSQTFKLSIMLEKNIPSKSGLGGGSSNAATLLKYLGVALKLPFEEIKRIAVKLGSDVPFFLKGGTAIGKGRGELLELPGDLSGYYVKLHFPESTVSTSEAYRIFDESGISYQDSSHAYEEVNKLWKAFKNHDYKTIRKLSRNDFEDVVFIHKPQIFSLFRSLESNKSIVKRMTGSG
ncbi:MAG: 4-(cytidine 5'-diphospho)-2-C-methyl-D-erythritol kinase, partial [Petrotogales bacterium]